MTEVCSDIRAVWMTAYIKYIVHCTLSTNHVVCNIDGYFSPIDDCKQLAVCWFDITLRCRALNYFKKFGYLVNLYPFWP